MHLFVIHDNVLTAFVSIIKQIVKAYEPLECFDFALCYKGKNKNSGHLFFTLNFFENLSNLVLCGSLQGKVSF